MDIILSNIPPVRIGNKNIHDCFEKLFDEADNIRIASGYISADALIELKNIFELNNKSFMELIIGMHGFDGFTKIQYESAKFLDSFLRNKKAGEVKIADIFKFHGKIYSFLKNGSPIACIVGSSNLTSIFDNTNTYEVDILIEEPETILKINDFVLMLSNKACISFNKFEIKNFIESDNLKLDGYSGVERISKEETGKLFNNPSNISFIIPIKADEAPKSNLNVYFGKGRINKKSFIKPRPWYEVELIVPSNITSDKNYPKGIISVYTDDGWKFRCKISGDYAKNFRSHDDLKILGRWIKGRLENAGVLKTGELITDKILNDYGRNNLELRSTDDSSIWLINFGV